MTELVAAPEIVYDTPLAGTNFTLSCDYTLGPSVDTDLNENIAWAVNGSEIEIYSGRIFNDAKYLVFSPLHTSDSGNYTCTLSLSVAPYYVTVQEPKRSVEEEVIVQSRSSFH